VQRKSKTRYGLIDLVCGFVGVVNLALGLQPPHTNVGADVVLIFVGAVLLAMAVCGAKQWMK
jgi:hypothetical protein